MRDREATEESLRAAAVALLRRGGVLAGLNLRQVADEARVNRGLVYQYFGSRRALLRSALFHRSRPNAEDAVDAAGLPLRERLSRLFWTSLRNPEPVRLATLLVLDGDRPASCSTGARAAPTSPPRRSGASCRSRTWRPCRRRSRPRSTGTRCCASTSRRRSGSPPRSWTSAWPSAWRPCSPGAPAGTSAPRRAAVRGRRGVDERRAVPGEMPPVDERDVEAGERLGAVVLGELVRLVGQHDQVGTGGVQLAQGDLGVAVGVAA